MKKKLAFIGAGGLAQIVYNGYINGLISDYEIIGIMDFNAEAAGEASEKTGARIYDSVEELIALKPDYIIEMAAVAAYRASVLKVLEAGIDFIGLSLGALADSHLREEVENTAVKTGSKVYIPSGSVGGYDMMQSIALMGAESASLSMRKGPDTLKGTKIYSDDLYNLKETTLVFDGNAREAIDAMPTKVNIGVGTALATMGVENTNIKMYCDPEMKDDDITIEVRSKDASCTLNFYSKPADIAAWSIINLLRNLASPIQFM